MIPTDIVDRVLGVLHSEKDYSTLETCSLVFPQFVDRHLYSQITLDLVEPGGLVPILPLKTLCNTIEPTYYVVDPTKFSRMLIDYPHVANYVRVVQIVITRGRVKLYPFRHGQLGDRLSSTSSILATLPHPEMIMVNVRGRLSWHRLGSNFCSAFLNSIQLPSITSIALSNINDFSLDHFDNCKNLKDLDLGGLFTHGETVSTSPYPRLRSLRIGDHSNLVRLVSWMKSNTLHTLSLRGSNLPQFQTLIKACSTTLVDLDIDHNFNYLNGLSITFPDLQLPFLDHFTFRSPINGPGYEDISPLSILLPFLGSIETLSSLSPIRLTLHLGLDFHDPDWSLITPVLILPIFRHPIELYLTCQRSVFAAGFDVLSLLEENSDMKRLQEAGALVAFIT